MRKDLSALDEASHIGSISVKVYEAWEKRSWHVGRKPTWRRVPAEITRYRRGTGSQMSRYALRRITGVRGKRIASGRSS